MRERDVSIPAAVRLEGTLVLPEGATAITVFAHGAGSSRHSPRNRFVARALQEVGIGTLLMDLLTEDEEAAEARGALLRFDIGVLADRLVDATRWLKGIPETRGLPVAYFGASTGAAAALVAAAGDVASVAAVVSRGGRPDLAAESLERVQAPTLLIVGSLDRQVIEMNRGALARLRCEKKLAIVEGASHLFEEPGTLEEVARLAVGWLVRHVSSEAGADSNGHV